MPGAFKPPAPQAPVRYTCVQDPGEASLGSLLLCVGRTTVLASIHHMPDSWAAIQGAKSLQHRQRRTSDRTRLSVARWAAHRHRACACGRTVRPPPWRARARHRCSSRCLLQPPDGRHAHAIALGNSALMASPAASRQPLERLGPLIGIELVLAAEPYARRAEVSAAETIYADDRPTP
jgi:hypothetical protein